jgi:hypothetical protein
MLAALKRYINQSLRCVECGRFVAYEDIIEGRAVHKLITPESLITHERFETLCKKHTLRDGQFGESQKTDSLKNYRFMHR